MSVRVRGARVRSAPDNQAAEVRPTTLAIVLMELIAKLAVVEYPSVLACEGGE